MQHMQLTLTLSEWSVAWYIFNRIINTVVVVIQIYPTVKGQFLLSSLLESGKHWKWKMHITHSHMLS